MNNKKMGYWFLAKATDNNISYFVGANLKGLFQWDHHKNVVELIDDFSDIKYDNELYDVGAVMDNKVFFPPKNSNKMLVYDIDNKNTDFVDLYTDEIKERIKFHPSYFGHHVYKKDCLYIFYREYPIVTIFRKDGTKNIVIYDLEEKIVIEKNYCEKNGVLFFPVATSNLILKFDTNTEKYEVIRLTCYDGKGISSVLYEENRLIMTSNDGKKIITYDIVSKREDTFDLPIDDIDIDDLYQIKKRKDDYILIPFIDVKKQHRMDCIWILDNEFKIKEKKNIDANIAKMKKWSVGSTKAYEWYFLFEPVYFDDGDLFWPHNMQLISLDYNSLNTCAVDFPLPIGFDEMAISKRIISSQLDVLERYNFSIYENERLRLDDFLDYYFKEE